MVNDQILNKASFIFYRNHWKIVKENIYPTNQLVVSSRSLTENYLEVMVIKIEKVKGRMKKKFRPSEEEQDVKKEKKKKGKA